MNRPEKLNEWNLWLWSRRSQKSLLKLRFVAQNSTYLVVMISDVFPFLNDFLTMAICRERSRVRCSINHFRWCRLLSLSSRHNRWSRHRTSKGRCLTLAYHTLGLCCYRWLTNVLQMLSQIVHISFLFLESCLNSIQISFLVANFN